MNKKYKVGFCFDGSFLPIRNGACYNVYNLMRSLADSGNVEANLMLCYRGWDNPKSYFNQKFRTIFINPDDYYNPNNTVEFIFNYHDIDFAQFYSSEGVLNLAPRLKKIGVKTVFEIQNIDYILYERLGSNKKHIVKTKNLQKKAIKLSDYILCRSEIDKNLAIQLGADPTKTFVYKGGVFVKDFKFKIRKEKRYKLVFLGHLFYPPNENAVKLIIEKVLPKLNKKYSLTIIGIGPQALMNKYKSDKVEFKNNVDNLSEELLNYDIALAPLFEGSGTRLKILDYLASGLPTITTSIGIEGLDSKIKDFLTIEDDISLYASKVEYVMNNLHKLSSISVNAREFLEETYDWSKCINPFLDIYGDIKHD